MFRPRLQQDFLMDNYGPGHCKNQKFLYGNTLCGWGGIRTHETLARLPVFKTGAFNHSATHPTNLIILQGEKKIQP